MWCMFNCLVVSTQTIATETEMAASAWVMAVGASKLCYLCSHFRSLNPTKRLMGTTKFITVKPNPSSTTRVQPSFPIRASNPIPEEPTSTTVNTFQEDLNYLWKLGAGSIVGAAVIKYGSIVFPEITRPNILLALFIVLTPVIVAVLLLVRQSRVKQQT